ncbi:MAG: glycerol-3-phosphate 1-O-acyltransferase PlsY [Herpetosiphonaceae bacterium]|nr:glycerol-3-phosphate 1-O-acyltransferase PlsY [Herpetosiphonaceae bacterium]
MTYLLIAALSYLVGSIPFGLIVGRLVGGVDVRAYGSKRTGATNVLRTMGARYGFLVFLLDFGKGVATVGLARLLTDMNSWAWALAAMMAMIGHIYPLFAGFKGGRGVATALGGVLGMFPWAFLAAFIVWWSVVLVTRYVSLGSILASIATAVTTGVFLLFGQSHMAIFLYCVLIAVIVVVSHGDNIARLRAGTESKFGQKVSVK